MRFDKSSLAGKSVRRVILFGGVLMLALVASERSALAHARTYAWSEEYQTLPKGTFEAESHTSVKVPHWDTSNDHSWKFEEELEYGVTDHLVIAHYQQWERTSQSGDNDFTKYKGFKFETKYRIGEKGKYWIDPLIYFEYEYEPMDRFDGAPHVFEEKIVLSKDFGKLNAVYNQIFESKLGHKGRTEHEFVFGLNYELLDSFRGGVEMKGQYWNPGVNRNELALGPTVAYEAKYFWIATGILFGVNHEANDFEARVRVGIPIG